MILCRDSRQISFRELENCVLCPRCGAEFLPDQKFCTNCGATLGVAENAQTVAAVAPGPTAPAAPLPAASLHAIPDGGLTLEDLVGWLQSAGYSAKVVTAPNGKRHIVSNTQGTPFNVFVGDCQGERCASMNFAAGFSTGGKFDVSQINDWNNNNRWCRAYYDDVKDPWLEMDIDLYPGGTWESVNDQFGTWNATLGRFIAKYSLK
jgi:Putative bacterial sensory transduction regulator/zinc-ribbon domain